jgi:hypothetical protein
MLVCVYVLSWVIIVFASVNSKFYSCTHVEQDRQCIYKHNIDACSCDHCCRGKAVSITYFECVYAALFIQHAKCMSHTVICGLFGTAICFHIIS